MSRIGHKIIDIPAGVEVTLNGSEIVVKGPKGTLTWNIPSPITAEIIDGKQIQMKRPNDEKLVKELHGTSRAIIHNMVVGVSQGFQKILDIVGIGYRAQMRGENLVLNAGYSHEVVIIPDAGVKISCASATEVHVDGIDRQAVGQTAARIRAVREPEPYKGKGIMYRGEVIIRKEGKRAGKK